MTKHIIQLAIISATLITSMQAEARVRGPRGFSSISIACGDIQDQLDQILKDFVNATTREEADILRAKGHALVLAWRAAGCPAAFGNWYQLFTDRLWIWRDPNINKVIDETPQKPPLLPPKNGFVYWQSNGGGCVPTDATIERNQYITVTGTGRVKYKGNGTNPLVFSCPLTSINPNVSAGNSTVLRLFYQDPDGPGEDFKVEATLRSFAKFNGLFTQEVCKVTSNKKGQWQEGTDTCRNIDMNNNLYWVQVVIKRNQVSSLAVEFNGVSLEGSIF